MIECHSRTGEKDLETLELNLIGFTKKISLLFTF